MKRQRYAPDGMLALNPRAFGFVFDIPEAPPTEMAGEVAIVRIRGPLMHHEDWCFDSYDEIKTRVRSALDQKPKALVLSIDSPGGLVSGCFDTAKEIRKLAADASVPLYAYVDGQATSAAYALACAAESIWLPETAFVGSIGVIDALVDATAQDSMWGVRFALVASGARKTDGNPHVAISEDALLAAQKRVDSLAEIFFAHVSTARSKSVDDIRALEAGLLHGAHAVEAGLADHVVTFDELLSMIAGDSIAKPKGDAAMASKYEEAVEALREAAESDDKDEAAKAKKMLAALEAEGDDEKKDDDAPADDKAEGDDEKKDDEEDAKAIALKALSAVHTMQVEASKKAENDERAALLASRPDFSPELAALLAKSPIAQVRDAVKTLPKGPARKAAVTTTVAGTRGETLVDGSGAPGPDDAMDIAMGLKSESSGIRREGFKKYLGAITPEEAKARAGGVK